MEFQSDVDFYMLKINRLQTDLSSMQEELMVARLRLRTAEDFQIKYQLLLKQSQQQNYRLRVYEEENSEKINEELSIQLRQNDKIWILRMNIASQQIAQQNQRNIDNLNREKEQLKERVKELENRNQEWELMNFKTKKLTKDNEILIQQIQQTKIQNDINKSEQLDHLREQLNAKNKLKLETERRMYEEQIKVLEDSIAKFEDILANNNGVGSRSDQDPNQIQQLKEQLERKLDSRYAQLSNLSDLLNTKNIIISQLQDDIQRKQKSHYNEKEELKNYLKILEDKIYQQQKIQNLELINLQNRMQKIREDQISVLRQQIVNQQNIYNEQRDLWESTISKKQDSIKNAMNNVHEEKKLYKAENQRLKRKIEQLKDRLKDFGDERDNGETQNLIKSLKDFQSREQNMSTYQNGVTFLDRQLKRSVTKIETKNLEIKRLNQEISQLRNQFETDRQNLRQNSKKEKKNYKDQVEKLSSQVRQLNQKLRNRQRDHKKREKLLECEIQRLNLESKSLTISLEQAHMDYKRVIDTKKQIEDSYRVQRQKGVTSKSDISSVRKQKWLELEKQKSDLEVVYKQREESIKSKFQIQKQRLRQQRDKLRAQNEFQKGVMEQLQKQQTKNRGDKENKNNVYKEFEKKMATLNLEIALSENIYHSLRQAKSRNIQDSGIREELLQEDQNENITLSFNPKNYDE